MFSVIIVNFNSGDRLARCLDHLSRQEFRDFETIVFDNASSDHSTDAPGDALARFRLIRSDANIGFAAANNRAAEKAVGDFLVFLNPDAYAAPDWLARVAEAIDRYPGVDAFGSTQINDADPSMLDGAGDVLHAAGIAYRGHFGWPLSLLPAEGACLAPCAAAAAYRKSAFDALGGFDERFFCYGEDVDLGLRLRMTGGETIQLNEARVRHEGSGVTGRHSAFSIYHGHRNRLWLARKNFPGVIFWGLLPLRLTADLALGVSMAMRGRLGDYLRALRDGYFGGGPLRSEGAAFRRRSALSARDMARLLAWSPMDLVRRKAVRLSRVG